MLNKDSTKISYPVLALRPNEQRLYSPTPFEGECYAVMLLETPSPPGAQHPETLNMTVLCAGQYKTLVHDVLDWGWIHLNFDTKEVIGNDMVEENFIPGQWYYMIVFSGLGNRSRGYAYSLLAQDNDL